MLKTKAFDIVTTLLQRGGGQTVVPYNSIIWDDAILSLQTNENLKACIYYIDKREDSVNVWVIFTYVTNSENKSDVDIRFTQLICSV